MRSLARLTRIGLGTAQWGMQYGIANRSGRPDDAMVDTMLATGSAAGVNLLDTSHDYGTAEEVLGRLKSTGRFEIVTKTPHVPPSCAPNAVLNLFRRAFKESLARLSRRHVHGLLLHDADTLLSTNADAVWTWLQELKSGGLVEKIGVSVYRPEELRRILDRFPIDIVQLPFNLYDQRFRKSGLLARLKAANVEVHTRSAFLQGLLLLPPHALGSGFDSIRSRHAELHAQVEAAGQTMLAASLGAALAQLEIDRVIVGCEQPAQLREILSAAAEPQPLIDWTQFSVDDERIVNPSQWA